MTLTSNHKNNTFFGFPDPNYLNKSGINHIHIYFFHFVPKGSKIYVTWPITGLDLWRKSTNDQILNYLYISYHHVKNQTCGPKCNPLVLRHPTRCSATVNSIIIKKNCISYDLYGFLIKLFIGTRLRFRILAIFDQTARKIFFDVF